MKESQQIKLQEKLNMLQGKYIEVLQKGFLQSQYTIAKCNYCFKKDILNFKDETSKSELKININQVYKIDYDKNRIKFYLDNDMEIVLKEENIG